MREGGVSTAKGEKRSYKGFVAGVFSGIAKLSGEYIYLGLIAAVPGEQDRSLDTHILFKD